MKSTVHATPAFEDRQQHAAALSVAVAQINAEPDRILHVVTALLRVLDIAAASPGGQQELLAGLTLCGSVDEVLAFCKMFVNIVAIESGHARHPYGGAHIQAVHDEEELV